PPAGTQPPTCRGLQVWKEDGEEGPARLINVSKLPPNVEINAGGGAVRRYAQQRGEVNGKTRHRSPLHAGTDEDGGFVVAAVAVGGDEFDLGCGHDGEPLID